MTQKTLNGRNIESKIDSYKHLKKYSTKNGIPLVKHPQKITFNHNINQAVHRWSPYIQGFSANFVYDAFKRNGITKDDLILDCFAGCGTVNVCAKMSGINSIGVELNPLMTFILKTKLDWSVNPSAVKNEIESMDFNIEPNITPPNFLLTKKQFNPDILRNLLVLKENITNVKSTKIRNLLNLIFASILIDSSNLKRSPSLGYVNKKNLNNNTPLILFSNKVNKIVEDLEYVRNLKNIGESSVIEADSKSYTFDEKSIDMVITSPPYANGIDYVINYKIELAWLDFVKSQEELRNLKERMIACDNISRKALKNFVENNKLYNNEQLSQVLNEIEKRMKQITYRRNDMHFVIQKYFDDMYKVMKNVYVGLVNKGKFILVVGDSVIANVYVPTDIILATMGKEIGFNIDSVVVARERRSGRDRSRTLRESIVTLSKIA